ncbi:hypothetical protein GF340_02365 [Candidatus Peregrinibacteria bacterium]|nr:hypothetical protein [Candidatus Peregrinibacteria bacterium]
MKKISLALVAVTALFMIGACSTGADNKETINDGLVAMTDMTAFTYEASATIETKGELSDSVSIAMEGATDFTNEERGKFQLDLAIDVESVEAGEGSVGGGLIVMDEMFYFNVKEFNFPDIEPFLAPYAEYFNQWWYIPVPEDEVTFERDEEVVAQLKKDLSDVNIIESAEYVADEEVMGDMSKKYDVVWNLKGLMEAMKTVSEVNGQDVTDDSFQESLDSLESFEGTGSVWISNARDAINKVEGRISGVDDLGQELEISFSMVFGNVNEAVEIEVPTNANEFPVAEIQALFLGGLAVPEADAPVLLPEDELPEDIDLSELEGVEGLDEDTLRQLQELEEQGALNDIQGSQVLELEDL